MAGAIVSQINSICIQSIVSSLIYFLFFLESNQVILAYEIIEKKTTSGMV